MPSDTSASEPSADSAVAGGYDEEPGITLLQLVMGNLVWIALLAVLFGVLGYGAAQARGSESTATALLMLEEPGNFAVFEPLVVAGAVRAGEYVADQVALLESDPLAGRVSSLMKDSDYDVTPTEVANSMEVVWSGTGRAVDISYTSGDEREAVDGANAVLAAYQTLAGELAEARFAHALDAIDLAIDSAVAETQAMEEELRAAADLGSDGGALVEQLGDVLDRITAIRESADPALAGELDQLTLELTALNAVVNAQRQDPRLNTLTEQTLAAVDRESQLRRRQLELQVDVDVLRTRSGAEFPATVADSVATGRLIATLSGALLGAFLALLVGYWRSQMPRGTRGGSPERILGAPLLGNVTVNAQLENVTQETLASSGTDRALARWIRTAADSVLSTDASSTDRSSGSESVSVAFVAANDDGHRAAALLRVALGAAESDLRVLVIDGDAMSQLTRSMSDAELVLDSSPGLSEAITNGDWGDEQSIQKVVLTSGASFDFVTSGLSSLDGIVTIRREFEEATASLFSGYDLVLIDVPTITNAPGIASELLATVVDVAVPVLRVDTPTPGTEAIRDALDALHTPAVGYITVVLPADEARARFRDRFRHQKDDLHHSGEPAPTIAEG